MVVVVVVVAKVTMGGDGRWWYEKDFVEDEMRRRLRIKVKINNNFIKIIHLFIHEHACINVRLFILRKMLKLDQIEVNALIRLDWIRLD